MCTCTHAHLSAGGLHLHTFGIPSQRQNGISPSSEHGPLSLSRIHVMYKSQQIKFWLCHLSLNRISSNFFPMSKLLGSLVCLAVFLKNVEAVSVYNQCKWTYVSILNHPFTFNNRWGMFAPRFLFPATTLIYHLIRGLDIQVGPYNWGQTLPNASLGSTVCDSDSHCIILNN